MGHVNYLVNLAFRIAVWMILTKVVPLYSQQKYAKKMGFQITLVCVPRSVFEVVHLTNSEHVCIPKVHQLTFNLIQLETSRMQDNN